MLEVQATPTLSLSTHRLQVGDHVVIARDVLAELSHDAPSLPPMWFCIPAGVRGRLIGWRDRVGSGESLGDTRAIVDLSTEDRHLVIFVSDHNVARVRGHGVALPPPARSSSRAPVARRSSETAVRRPEPVARPRRSYRHRHR